MLEKIPDYNQDPKSSYQTATGVDLAPVVISPSLLLYRLEIFIYLAMLLFASVAIFPFLLTAFYWPLLWLVFASLIGITVKTSMRARHASSVSLRVTQKVWYMQTAEGDRIVKPCGDILVWTALVMVPVEDTLSGQKHRLVALPDSMSAEDWRRLRVWLRMALPKNT